MVSHVDPPEPVARIAALMSTFAPQWALCGGWAVDAWLGRQTRDHFDLDITVFHDDQRAIFDHLAGWRLVGHDPNVADDSKELWNGRTLDLPAHVHAEEGDFKLEVLLNERSSGDWVLSREPHITRPLARCVQQSPWGMPTVVPELLLFYKATEHFDVEGMKERPHDKIDFLALLPHLSEGQGAWLREAITLLHPGHPWLTHPARS